jgi:hypothetical protein
MATVYTSISDKIADFIRVQPIFFVASAPLTPQGHINLSPKGLDCFRILSPQQVAYLDITGSGNETSAHLEENGRITFMFCSFNTAPMILRLFGRGRVILPNTHAWSQFAAHFSEYPGVRQIIVADITRVQTSCGFAVPQMELVKQRDTLFRWVEAQGEEGLAAFQCEHNRISIDGLHSSLAKQAEPA